MTIHPLSPLFSSMGDLDFSHNIQGLYNLGPHYGDYTDCDRDSYHNALSTGAPLELALAAASSRHYDQVERAYEFNMEFLKVNYPRQWVLEQLEELEIDPPTEWNEDDGCYEFSPNQYSDMRENLEAQLKDLT